MSALFRLTARQMLGSGKIWVLSLFLGLPVLLIIVVLVAGGLDIDGADEEMAAGMFLYVLYPQSLCILAALLYGSSLLASEIEDKTLVYLFTRAVPRWHVLVGKHIATVAVLTAMVGVSMTISYLLFGMPVGIRLWFALLTSIFFGTLAYTAIFAFLGLLVPRRAIPVGLIYAVVFELFLSFVPAVINEVTVSYYLRSLAFEIADVASQLATGIDIPPEVMRMIGGAGVGGAVLALALITAGALGLSALVMRRREWPLTEGV